MDPERLASVIIGLVMAATALGMSILMMRLTSSAAAGKLKRNQWSGIRTPATMRSDAAWVAGHRAAARTTPAYFAIALGTCAFTFLALIQNWTFVGVLLVGVCGLCAIVIAAIATAIVASRAANAADDGPNDGTPE